MAGNPWLDVLTGFNQSYNRGAQNYEQQQNELQRQRFQSEEEKQRSADELQRQKEYADYKNKLDQENTTRENQDIQGKLSALLSGKNTNVSYSPDRQIQMPGGLPSIMAPNVSQTDMSPQDKMRTLLGLPKGVQDEYSKYQKQQEDAGQSDLVNSLVNEKDPDKIKAGITSLTSDNLKKYTEIKNATKPPTAREETIKEFSQNGRVRQMTGYPASEGDPGAKQINGKWYNGVKTNEGFKMHETDSETGYGTFTKEGKALFDDYFKKQQKILKSVYSGYDLKGNKFDTKNKDGSESEDMKNLKAHLHAHNQAYVQIIKDSMPESARKWYESKFNQMKDTKTGNINPKEYWANVRDAFISGKLGKGTGKKDADATLDYRYLRELYKASYEQEPPKLLKDDQ